MSRRSHQLRVRWMRQADADDLLHVERSTFGRAQRDVRRLLEWVEKPTSLAVVAEKHHRIVGYLLARHRARAVTVCILNVAVHPHHQRRGAASLLFRYLVHHLASYPGHVIETLAPERALEYQLFLRNRGFQAVEIKRSAFDSGQDGYLFTREAPASAEPLPF